MEPKSPTVQANHSVIVGHVNAWHFDPVIVPYFRPRYFSGYMPWSSDPLHIAP